MAMCHDVFAHSMEPLSLLLFFGDLTASRVGFAKVNDAHKRMLARVRQGTASPERCADAMRTPFTHALCTKKRKCCECLVPPTQ